MNHSFETSQSIGDDSRLQRFVTAKDSGSGRGYESFEHYKTLGLMASSITANPKISR